MTRAQDVGGAWDGWTDELDRAVLDVYGGAERAFPTPPTEGLIDAAQRVLTEAVQETTGLPAPVAAGVLRARAQQALVIELADAVRKGDLDRARLWRARLHKPRGTSSAEGATLLQALDRGNESKRDETARLLVREAITWQTTRARQLLDAGLTSIKKPVPLPGRLGERFGEALALADLPQTLRDSAGLTGESSFDSAAALTRFQTDAKLTWGQPLATALQGLQREAESSLPSLLTPEEKARREIVLLKLAKLIPLEYQAGVRDGQIVIPLEYREAVSFTAQSRQIVGELAPLWLGGDKADALREPLAHLEKSFADVADAIDRKVAPAEIDAAYKQIVATLEGPFEIVLKRRGGTTQQIIEEIMIDVRRLMSESLAAALAGKWDEAESLRLEAYTTFDPDIEARLMPRDPTLALNIEKMLLDGLTVEEPGIKTLLDRRASAVELEKGYARVVDAMNRGASLLTVSVDPTAAAINAGSIVLREGLEGLLVIVAIFAGLRGEENARRRRLFWVGIVGSMAATALTWALSRTVITSLNAYAEVIAAVTGVIAIGILLLITNWLFQQVYWKQWVTTLKSHAAGESTWQLVSVGFLVGYREGFETVLFLQSLMLDAGGQPVAWGVIVGSFILLALGFAALRIGLKLPYYKILLVTAVMIGLVLVTFVGGTVRALQTVNWLPVHRFTDGSWPNWIGMWLGLYNTWESVIAQAVTILSVIGTWRWARWNSKRKTAKRRAEMQESREKQGTQGVQGAALARQTG